MKKFIFTLLFAYTFCIGCKSDNPRELIVKKWRITDITAPNMVVPDSIKNALRQATMEFTKDGKFLITGLGMGDDQSGTYSLSDDGKKLITVTYGRSETNEINELTKIKMIITDLRNSSKLTAVPK
ncbi:MAG: lipocalin family protein [Bacteroidota bacterium]|nr:lipocalin family protein [Bacteroidota bacterium]